MKKFIFLLFSLPAISFAQSNPTFIYTQTCFGNKTTLVASSSLPDTSIQSWEWHLPDNGTDDTIQYGKKIIYLFTPKDTNAVRLRIVPYSQYGSPQDTTKNVIIDPLPNVNFHVNNVCKGKTATYIDTSTISSGYISNWYWNFDWNPSNDTMYYATGKTGTFTVGSAKTYQTKLKCVSNQGCSAFAIKTTEAYATPQAAFVTSNACVNSNAIFTNTSTDTTNLDFYLWNFGDGNQSSTSGNAAHAYSSSGTYTVVLIAATQSGCRDTTASFITINPLPAVSVTANGPTAFCAGSNVLLDAGSGFSSYLWNNASSTQSIDVSVSGDYNVTVTDANGCTNTASESVIVNPLPIVSITANGDTVLHAYANVILMANGASNYLWSTGSFSNNITVSESGTYSVLGTDANECTGYDSIRVVNENPNWVYISVNIITPNGDGINDYLVIENIDTYTNCNLTIYNMWNDEVYSVSGYKNDWHGHGNDGKQVPDGPYYYTISCDGKPLLKGNINVILR